MVLTCCHARPWAPTHMTCHCSHASTFPLPLPTEATPAPPPSPLPPSPARPTHLRDELVQHSILAECGWEDAPVCRMVIAVLGVDGCVVRGASRERGSGMLHHHVSDCQHWPARLCLACALAGPLRMSVAQGIMQLDAACGRSTQRERIEGVLVYGKDCAHAVAVPLPLTPKPSLPRHPPQSPPSPPTPPCGAPNRLICRTSPTRRSVASVEVLGSLPLACISRMNSRRYTSATWGLCMVATAASQRCGGVRPIPEDGCWRVACGAGRWAAAGARPRASWLVRSSNAA